MALLFIEQCIITKKKTLDEGDGWFLKPSWLKWTANHHRFQQGWTGGLKWLAWAEKKPQTCLGASPEARGNTSMLQRLNSFLVEAIQSRCGGYTVMLPRLYSHVAEAIWPYWGGFIAMLRRLYIYGMEAIQSRCRGYTVMLPRLYIHVAEAMWPYWRGFTAMLRSLYIYGVEAIQPGYRGYIL